MKSLLGNWPKLSPLCLAALIVSLGLGLGGTHPAHARTQFVTITVDETPDSENCGIASDHILQTVADAAQAEKLRIRPSNGDFIIYADVNVIGIPDSLGMWSKSCAYNLNLEVQRHQEINIKGIGRTLASAKLCDVGFIGYISDGNLDFLDESLKQSLKACLSQLPPRALRAITR